jgi:polyisoprenoid-binding protein YceI
MSDLICNKYIKSIKFKVKRVIMQFKKLLSILTSVLVTMVAISGFALSDQTFKTDQGHTEVLFGWSHSGVSMQHAEFTVATGTLNLADDIENSSINVAIDANSLSSGFNALDRDLKSANFLDVANHPEITFQSTSVKKTGENTLDVTGDLTIHGVTNPATLNVEITHQGTHPVAAFFDYFKGDWIAFRATTDIDHMAFGVGSFSTGPISVEINTEMKAQ